MALNSGLVHILGSIVILQRGVIDGKNMIPFLVENMHDLFINIRVSHPKFSVDLRPHLCGGL